jgi:hypothetical protein
LTCLAEMMFVTSKRVIQEKEHSMIIKESDFSVFSSLNALESFIHIGQLSRLCTHLLANLIYAK